MRFRKTIGTWKKNFFGKAHRHQSLFLILFLLSIAAALSNVLLRGDLLSSSTAGDSSSNSSLNLRTCTSKGTVFEELRTLKEATDRFSLGVSAVIDERENYFRSPSKWSCLSSEDGGNGPPVGALRALAELLPGWNFRSAFGATTLRPVIFESFTSILGEFQREYECKLAEFSYSADGMVARNLDLDDPQEFCCDRTSRCVQATGNVSCLTITFDNPECNGQCPTGNTHAVLAVRLEKFRTRIENEKQRARTAMLRTIHALRSFEINYVYALQLTCFQRASLDLKSELSLLADATSCMPKIWDAVTSLHDPDDSLTPE